MGPRLLSGKGGCSTRKKTEEEPARRLATPPHTPEVVEIRIGHLREGNSYRYGGLGTEDSGGVLVKASAP